MGSKSYPFAPVPWRSLTATGKSTDASGDTITKLGDNRTEIPRPGREELSVSVQKWFSKNARACVFACLVIVAN
jgi:hypothetical protein